MRDLNYQLKRLGRRNRDGSFATQADRERMLALLRRRSAARRTLPARLSSSTSDASAADAEGRNEARCHRSSAIRFAIHRESPTHTGFATGAGCGMEAAHTGSARRYRLCHHFESRTSASHGRTGASSPNCAACRRATSMIAARTSIGNPCRPPRSSITSLPK